MHRYKNIGYIASLSPKSQKVSKLLQKLDFVNITEKSKFEFNGKIGPPAEKLYAVLPVGVDNIIPSPLNFSIF